MIIAGDVGGTNARLAFFESSSKREPLHLQNYASRDFTDFSSILRRFIENFNLKQIDMICLGIAGPIQNGKCHATNLPWVIDSKRLSLEFEVSRVYLINDLEANAWGLGVLNPDEFMVLNEGAHHDGNAALISAGTGLGEAGLFWNGSKHIPFACEGGHADFAPTNDLEMHLWNYLKRQFDHLSYERVLSGSGIYHLYRFLIDSKREKENPSIERGLEQKEPQKMITELALSGKCEACVHTLDLFSSIYGREAGNLALKFFALNGVFIGGGIAPKISSFLKKGGFMKSFTEKGRFSSLLSSIPVKVILNDKTALLGAMRYGQEKS